jgi:ABC-type enterochelin transport system permease subunit
MKIIVKALLAIYNFLVGDPIILMGALLSFIIVELLIYYEVPSLIPAIVLIAGIIISLGGSLIREIRPPKR